MTNSRRYDEKPTGSAGMRIVASIATMKDTRDRQARIILICLLAFHLSGFCFLDFVFIVLSDDGNDGEDLCGLIGVDIMMDEVRWSSEVAEVW